MIAASEQEPVSLAENPLRQYAPATGIFDEMLSPAGTIRDHWLSFARSVGSLSRHELASRWENGLRIVRDHDVTYNVYSDARGTERPWALDLAPLLISADEWSWLERGLAQRTRLLNLILEDIYGGSQRLLRDGFLPPDLIYANPGFLRACRGFLPAQRTYLSFSACDLGRSADGKWWALADRTQAPSGAGYALENRAVLSRILPDELRESRVCRLGSFFRTRQKMLVQLAAVDDSEPRGVLLTPGPLNETYFEHAYLARNLGLPLVEGADLTVRDRRVFLKTVEGLQRVDYILRRVDDSYCDPLELRSESFLGVPGLVEAARAGNVVISNALGSGVLESPILLAFLPVLCQHLLQEELLIPSVATWWCGQSRERQYVLDNFDYLVIKPAFGKSRRQPWFGGRLTKSEKANLIRAIKAEPQNYVGQERLVMSRSPVFRDGIFESRSVVLRTFVAGAGDTYAVMPGGLARVAPTVEDPVVTMQGGGGSKDVWVRTNNGDLRQPAETRRVVKSVTRGSNTVPSRAADNLFWLGRYAERLENTLRLLRRIVERLIDDAERDGSTIPLALPELFNALALPFSNRLVTNTAIRQHVLRLIFNKEAIGSVRELLGRIHGVAAHVRDRFSGDTWRILVRMDREVRGGPGKLPLTTALALIHRLVLDLAAFSGLEMENMTRGHGWRFLDIGRRIERGICMTQFLRGAVLTGDSSETFELLLEIADSTMTYRRLYFSEVRPLEAIDLLLRDESNPRSVLFQLQQLTLHAQALPGENSFRCEADNLAMVRILNRIQGREPAAAGQGWLSGNMSPLMGLLENCVEALSGFSEELTHSYFSHALTRVS
ncbi:hypothetical protein GC207_01080 [bacterium]|nr:hypothetical protein [bacterium]